MALGTGPRWLSSTNSAVVGSLHGAWARARFGVREEDACNLASRRRWVRAQAGGRAPVIHRLAKP
jgi:hypothetical protein